MNKTMRTLIALILVAAALAQSAFAAYEDVGVSARVTGLGAYTAVADDAYSIYYNPAGLATLGQPELATTYSRLLGGLSDNSNLQNSFIGYAQPIDGGKYGAAGVAWNYFTLDTLYRESSVYGTYAHSLFGETLPEKLYAGVSLKLLSRGLGATSVANNAIGPTGEIETGVADPVLQNSSKTNFDADLGLLYRVRPNWTLGFATQHILQPNIAFSSNDTDLLERTYYLGGAYHTPFATLSADLDLLKAANGSPQNNIVLGAEKWLPTLLYGAFGVRGSLAVGSNEYRQMTVGVSYKIRHLQFDYGFQMPLGGIANTFGTQRVGVTLRFGSSSKPEPKVAEAILENMSDLADVGTPEFRYEMENLALYKRAAIGEMLRQAMIDVSAGNFADALDKVEQAAALQPSDVHISEERRKLRIVAGVFSKLRDYTNDPGQAAVYDAVLEYLDGMDKEALEHLEYARSLRADPRIDALIAALGAAPSVAPSTAAVAAAPVAIPAAPAVAISTANPQAQVQAAVQVAAQQTAQESAEAAMRKVVEGMTALVEVAFAQKEYDKVIDMSKRVVELDPANALAYRRMGVAYHALKRYPEALTALRSAYKLEINAESKRTLKAYIDAIKELVARRAPAPAAVTAVRKAAAVVATPQDLERLYDEGVELYAQGRLTDAAAKFREILSMAPDNVPARRALKRVEAETMQSGTNQ